MNNKRVPSLLELPPEILSEITSLLSTNDLSVCVRISKSWHHAFQDSLWHTVELKDASCYDAKRPVFDRIKSLYGPHLVIRGKETVASKSPFLRNLHRVRVIKVQYTSFLNLFWDQDPSPLESIPLKELQVDFENDPQRLDGFDQPSEPSEPPRTHRHGSCPPDPRAINSAFNIFVPFGCFSSPTADRGSGSLAGSPPA